MATQSGVSNASNGKKQQLWFYFLDPIMCSSFYLISLWVICAVAGQVNSVIFLDYFSFHSKEKEN